MIRTREWREWTKLSNAFVIKLIIQNFTHCVNVSYWNQRRLVAFDSAASCYERSKQIFNGNRCDSCWYWQFAWYKNLRTEYGIQIGAISSSLKNIYLEILNTLWLVPLSITFHHFNLNFHRPFEPTIGIISYCLNILSIAASFIHSEQQPHFINFIESKLADVRSTSLTSSSVAQWIAFLQISSSTHLILFSEWKLLTASFFTAGIN